MAGFMQVSGRDIRDKTITDDDISDVANIAISKINGLQAALDSKAATPIAGSAVSLSTTNFTKNLSSSENTVQLAMDKLDDMATGGGETVVTSVSSLTSINCSLGSYYIINVSESATISLASVTASKIYTLAIKNTGSGSITITLPANGIASNPSFTIGAGNTREFSFINAGSVIRWQVSTEVAAI